MRHRKPLQYVPATRMDTLEAWLECVRICDLRSTLLGYPGPCLIPEGCPEEVMGKGVFPGENQGTGVDGVGQWGLLKPLPPQPCRLQGFRGRMKPLPRLPRPTTSQVCSAAGGLVGTRQDTSSVSTVPTHGSCQPVLPHPQRPGPGRDRGHAKEEDRRRQRNEAALCLERPVSAGRDAHTGLAEASEWPCEVAVTASHLPAPPTPFWSRGQGATERPSALSTIAQLPSTEPVTLAPESRSFISREPGPGGRGRAPMLQGTGLTGDRAPAQPRLGSAPSSQAPSLFLPTMQMGHSISLCDSGLLIPLSLSASPRAPPASVPPGSRSLFPHRPGAGAAKHWIRAEARSLWGRGLHGQGAQLRDRDSWVLLLQGLPSPPSLGSLSKAPVGLGQDRISPAETRTAQGLRSLGYSLGSPLTWGFIAMQVRTPPARAAQPSAHTVPGNRNRVPAPLSPVRNPAPAGARQEGGRGCLRRLRGSSGLGPLGPSVSPAPHWGGPGGVPLASLSGARRSWQHPPKEESSGRSPPH